ncbi:MAG: (Fe-S)-binding protein [Gammaproteobacteria bacterium]
MFDFRDKEFGDVGDRAYSGPYIPDAGECLRCGVCIGSCPTYRLFGFEEETPRRRIRTIGKLLVDKLPISFEERRHLDNCLECRACESVCPSRMAFGQLFDQTRVQLKITPSRLAKIALWLIENKHWRARLMPLPAMYLKSGLQKPLRKSGLLRKLQLENAEVLLGKPALRPLASHYPAGTATRGRVALFTGCIADQFDRETLLAAVKLINAGGFDVVVPFQQGCCGAIHQHNGQSAAALIDHNIRVFNALDVDAVIHTASGCGAMLSEYSSQDGGEAATFRERLLDIHDFLMSRWPDDLQLKPKRQKVSVHEPCSQRNVLRNPKAVYTLLEKIPGLNIAPLADNHICCGAGGSYMLTHPENAAQLRRLKREAIAGSGADIIVSANFGCSVFLNADTERAICVVHPLILLAAQL